MSALHLYILFVPQEKTAVAAVASPHLNPFEIGGSLSAYKFENCKTYNMTFDHFNLKPNNLTTNFNIGYFNNYYFFSFDP